MRPRFLAIAHLKGGSGGTTLAVNLAAGLASKKHPTLLLDLDPIAAATWSLVPPDRAIDRTIADALDNRADLAAVLVETGVERLRLAPASAGLAAWDRKPERLPVELARVLAQVPAGVDYVLLDLPPSAGAIVRGALAVLPGGRVLAPVQSRALDLVGFSDLVRLVESLAEQNPDLHLAGVVPMRQNRTALSADVIDALTATHGRRVLPGIRDAVAVAAAPLRHLPVLLTAPKSAAASDIRALVRAVLALK